MADQIKKNISFAKDYTYREQPDYDIDGLCLITGKKTASLMTGNNFSTVYYEKLGLSLSAESNDKQAIKIFNFSYPSGGTRGNVTHPIIQWKNASGKTFAYNFSTKINCEFYDIYPLKSTGRNLYLLIGAETGDGNCYQGIAYVIEIKSDYLLTDNAIFANRPYLNLCNREYDFDVKTQVLTSLLQDESSRNPLDYALYNQEKYSENKEANEELAKLIQDGFNDENTTFNLKFNGNQFVKEK
ncbi:MAG: hypothetical protein ABIP95_10620 [Pelobium sp.]